LISAQRKPIFYFHEKPNDQQTSIPLKRCVVVNPEKSGNDDKNMVHLYDSFYDFFSLYREVRPAGLANFSLRIKTQKGQKIRF